MPVFLEEFVESGTIDNRVRGKITGHLVIRGIEEPVPIDLVGNAQPDLAGCVITFTNREARPIEDDLKSYCSEAFIGEAGLVTGSHKGLVYLPTKDPNLEYMIDDFGEEEFASLNYMSLEWFRSGFQHFQLRGIDYETDISLPEWRIDESDLVEQMERAQSLTALYDEFVREMEEEDFVDRQLNEWDSKIDLIRPLLLSAKSDEERFHLIRMLVCSDYGYAVLVVREFSDNPEQYPDDLEIPSNRFDDDDCPF